MTTRMPDPAEVGSHAAAIMSRIVDDPEYDRLADSAQKYSDCWATYSGYPIIAHWNLDTDKGPLFIEGLRVLCLKAAVYELTGGDEQASELVVSAPVDEMVHAILAQTTLSTRMAARQRITWVHMTDCERFGFTHGSYAHECYTAAGWGEPPARYWIDADETIRRLTLLNERYASIGIGPEGRRHSLDFATPAKNLVVV